MRVLYLSKDEHSFYAGKQNGCVLDWATTPELDRKLEENNVARANGLFNTVDRRKKRCLDHSIFSFRYFQTDTPSDFTLVAQSYKHDENGDFYGTYTTGLGTEPIYTEEGSNSKLGVYRACLEVKCPPFSSLVITLFSLQLTTSTNTSSSVSSVRTQATSVY